MPDELFRQARQAGLNISKLTQGAVQAELDRHSKSADLDASLSESDAEAGPIGDGLAAYGPSDPTGGLPPGS